MNCRSNSRIHSSTDPDKVLYFHVFEGNLLIPYHNGTMYPIKLIDLLWKKKKSLNTKSAREVPSLLKWVTDLETVTLVAQNESRFN